MYKRAVWCTYSNTDWLFNRRVLASWCYIYILWYIISIYSQWSIYVQRRVSFSYIYIRWSPWIRTCVYKICVATDALYHGQYTHMHICIYIRFDNIYAHVLPCAHSNIHDNVNIKDKDGNTPLHKLPGSQMGLIRLIMRNSHRLSPTLSGQISY